MECILIGNSSENIVAITSRLMETLQRSITTIAALGIAINQIATHIPADSDYMISLLDDLVMFTNREKVYSGEWETPIEKVHCYFIAFVLFLVAHKCILPIKKKQIKMNRVAYGFE